MDLLGRLRRAIAYIEVTQGNDTVHLSEHVEDLRDRIPHDARALSKEFLDVKDMLRDPPTFCYVKV